MFLSKIEIERLSGYRSRACQRRWCLQNGVQFMLRGDGSLVVLKQHVEELLGSEIAGHKSQPEPDFTTLK